ncbi:hypothetical protein E0F91_15705 [Flavobacterium sandaracinum]|uniref:Uncharacterized protein n=2 Tax=Flavobacterium TaxID=237 RepID=A0A4R5CQM1_9FLAO|nr:hypothetical protein DR980_06705 [Flavobacterium psychrolimnae]TDE00714.1 hypothetical protein E0F91_15705 [Flavobacterium sandaracinum]
MYKAMVKILKTVWIYTMALLLWSFSAKSQQRYQTRNGSIVKFFIYVQSPQNILHVMPPLAKPSQAESLL